MHSFSFVPLPSTPYVLLRLDCKYLYKCTNVCVCVCALFINLLDVIHKQKVVFSFERVQSKNILISIQKAFAKIFSIT